MSFEAWRARLRRLTGISVLAKIATLRPRDAGYLALEIDPGGPWPALLRRFPTTHGGLERRAFTSEIARVGHRFPIATCERYHRRDGRRLLHRHPLNRPEWSGGARAAAIRKRIL
ncbi:hypothetical protein [Nannocystis exedens]|uniref:hypothetical protein n=1 Tax=Nannocystis exedens TaxID=54 RepID=UPI000BCDABF2|nr:hypothetical protein [Nannocystis exedens]PCC74690.1 hypothetical protein NAEX_07787 [Nannocystis exedens]